MVSNYFRKYREKRIIDYHFEFFLEYFQTTDDARVPEVIIVESVGEFSIS